MLDKAIKYALIGTLAASVSSEMVERRMVKYDIDILEPIDMVSIVMPSYNEEEFVKVAASTIKDQSIVNAYPDKFELILVDSGSTDNTVSIAKPYMDRIIEAPRGKLTARNLATDQAKGNIIVSVDADTYYPYHYLNTLLEPFNNISNPNYQNVVGVYGSNFDYTTRLVPGPLFSLGDFLYSSIVNTRMTGRNSAFYKHAFYLADKLDESINQFQIMEIFNEEEKLFGRRLAKFGKIIYKLNASCHHLAGFKSLYRIVKNKKAQDKYNFGIDRF